MVTKKCQEDYQRAMLEMHNKYRLLHGVPKLKIDKNLQASALRHAERNALSGSLDTSTAETDTNVNAAMISGNLKDCYGMAVSNFNSWYVGESQYDYKKGGFSLATGAFTQIVWKSTKKLGCAVFIKNSEAYGICQYSPAGNYAGKFKENVLPQNRLF